MFELMLMSKQIVEMVNVVMVLLFEELCQVIILCEIEGLSYEEIVEMMGCLIGMVCLWIFCVCEVIVVKLCLLFDMFEGKCW